MTTILLLATTAGLAAIAAWWIRRTNLAVAPAGRPVREPRPLAQGCELGSQLLMAASDAGEPAAAGQPGSAATAPAPDTPGPAVHKKRERKPRDLPSRREFLRVASWGAWMATLGGFGGASLMFLWPNLRGGFGARLDVGTEEEILADIRANKAPYEFPAGRTYFVEYSEDLDPDGQYAEITGGAKVMALYWRCVHLGCKVPWCQTSQWFECPCHGSRYNRWGEWQGGPAPRGLDRFPVFIEDGRLIVDTGQLKEGPPRQAPSLQQPQEGPSCL
ncbi:MAG TPA: Rieske 2Fe-2S domain-containing protein [Egibacteraceae bacterium]|nr:Rieske 2Fe-2S domain-containing protein [Egibacteraceae bacterium]